MEISKNELLCDIIIPKNDSRIGGEANIHVGKNNDHSNKYTMAPLVAHYQFNIIFYVPEDKGNTRALMFIENAFTKNGAFPRIKISNTTYFIYSIYSYFCLDSLAIETRTTFDTSFFCLNRDLNTECGKNSGLGRLSLCLR